MPDVEPASITQVRQSRDGRMVLIEDDAGNVAASLRAIDPNLRLRQSEVTGHYVVYEEKDGRQELVLTSKHLDHRLVWRILEIRSADYDFLAELERQDAQAKRDADHRNSEAIGEVAERLAHAARRDLGPSRIFVPDG